MRAFYFIGAAGIVSALDCSGVAPYRGGLYPEAKTNVHHANDLYYNQWYVDQTAVPGVDPAWYKVGTCDEGTTGELVVNCEEIPEWKEIVYTDKTYVKYESFLWRNEWYADASAQPGKDNLWVRQGLCGDSGHVTVPVFTVPVVTPAPAVTPSPVTTPKGQVTQAPSTTTTTTTTTTKGAVIVPPTGGNSLNGWPSRFYAPFVDVCLGVQPNYNNVYQTSGTNHFMLSFITATSACEGTWGGVYTLAQGPYANFQNDINTIRGFGGDVGVSFGGQIGTELADLAACQAGDAVGNIKKAYLQVIDKFNLKHVDFDIESHAIDESKRSKGWKLRFDAVKQIQAERPDVVVSWTLPVLPTGLLPNALNFVEDLLKSGVRLDLINVMTMDYGAYYSGGKTMSQCELDAIDSLAKQVFSKAQTLGLLSNYGWTSATDVYPYLGSTPMIGVNDVASEIYSLQDASTSLSAWQSGNRPLRMWSNWSLTRDLPCSGGWAQATCSSGNVQTTPYQFAATLNKFTTA